MECRYSTYHCLCSYLLDGTPGEERMESIQSDPMLCPKCKTCTRREEELEQQRNVRLLIQKRCSKDNVPLSFKKRVESELGRIEDYRESGIQALDLIPWGTHIAQLYNTRSDQVEVLAPYIEQGLKCNELCVWITAEIPESEARDALASRIPNLGKHLEKRQLQFFSYKDWYLPEGHFDPSKVLDSAAQKYQEALSCGYSGIRATGDVSWLDQSDWDSLMEYETLLDGAVSNSKALAVCIYKEDECTKDKIVDVMDRHEYTISKVDDSWRVSKSTSD